MFFSFPASNLIVGCVFSGSSVVGAGLIVFFGFFVAFLALRFVNQILDHLGKFVEFFVHGIKPAFHAFMRVVRGVIVEVFFLILLLWVDLGIKVGLDLLQLLIERAHLTKHHVVRDFLTIFHVVAKLRDLAFNY